MEKRNEKTYHNSDSVYGVGRCYGDSDSRQGISVHDLLMV